MNPVNHLVTQNDSLSEFGMPVVEREIFRVRPQAVKICRKCGHVNVHIFNGS